MKKIILLIMLLSAAVFLYAQEADTAIQDFSDETKIILDESPAENAAEAVESERFFTTWDFVRVILILAAVILIIYAIFYFLKKSGGGKFQNNELIRLLGSQSLTQNSSVHLIAVGSKYYLVGSGEGAVNHIADIDDKETVDDLMLRNPQVPQEGKRSFADLFNVKIGRKTPVKQNVGERIKNNNKFMHDQAERLKKM